MMRSLRTKPELRRNVAFDGVDRIRITELARRLGTTPRAIRHYEDLRLITPKRTRAGARIYCPDTRSTLESIVALRRAGTPIEQIKSILIDSKDGENLDQKVSAALRVRLRDLQKQIDELTSLISQFSAVDVVEPITTAGSLPRPCDGMVRK